MPVDVGLMFERAEMQMIRWMCGISIKDGKTSVELRRLVGVEPITTDIRSGKLRWYGHVKRKSDEDWVKKCMENRVEGSRPVGRPRKTWLENVESDMAELDIYNNNSPLSPTSYLRLFDIILIHLKVLQRFLELRTTHSPMFQFNFNLKQKIVESIGNINRRYNLIKIKNSNIFIAGIVFFLYSSFYSKTYQ